jgi:hypothetical protein
VKETNAMTNEQTPAGIESFDLPPHWRDNLDDSELVQLLELGYDLEGPPLSDDDALDVTEELTARAAWRASIAAGRIPPVDYDLHRLASVGYDVHVGLDLDRYDPRTDTAAWYVRRPGGFRRPATIEWFPSQAEALVSAANRILADVENETGETEPRLAVLRLGAILDAKESAEIVTPVVDNVTE